MLVLMAILEVEKRNKETPNMVFKPYLVFFEDRIGVRNSESGPAVVPKERDYGAASKGKAEKRNNKGGEHRREGDTEWERVGDRGD